MPDTQSVGLVCEQCGALQTNSLRSFFPLWFVGPEGQSLCPDCAPSTKVTSQLARINAHALRARATPQISLGPNQEAGQ